MLSYNWGHQDVVKNIKAGLDKAGFNVWMDVEQMAGSTLEASKHYFLFFCGKSLFFLVALAVEQSAVVLICFSRKYKESAACRTEAEYAFTLRKPIIPLRMENNYTADGWYILDYFFFLF